MIPFSVNIHRILAIVGLLMLTLATSSSLIGQEVSPLNLRSRVLFDSLTLSWAATTPTDWAAIRDGGVVVERYALPTGISRSDLEEGSFDWDALPSGQRASRFPEGSGAFRPQEEATFTANRFVGGGYTGAMGIMLYDSTFNSGGDQASIDRQQMEMAAFGHSFLVDSVGLLMGAQLRDGQLDSTGLYLYHVYAAADPSIRQEVIIRMEGGLVYRYNNDLGLDLTQNPFYASLPALPRSYPFAVKAKAFEDSIVVRWAPLDPDLLRKSTRAKYIVSRTKTTGNTAEAADSTTVTPWSAEDFGYLDNASGEEADLLLIAAQTLYGEIQNDAETSREEALEAQWVYGLQAADQSASAANALGLRFVDYAVKAGEAYTYQVSMVLDSIDPQALPVAGTVGVVNQYGGPEELTGFSAREGENLINLALDRANGDNYTQYYFERSADGGATWTPLSAQPIVFEADAKIADQVRYYLYPDSVTTLYQPYRYRVRGRNAFQEYSPWAEITAMARDRTPPPVAFPAEPEMLTTEILRLSWDGEMSATAPDLAGYYVKMGHISAVENQPIVSELLPPGTVSWEYNRPGVPFTNDSSYFFQVAAVDTAGNMSNSFPVALRVIDSIPPAPPTGLQAKMDTNGVVTLLWEASPERDAAGYQVYFANDSTDNFVQITKEDLSYNFYRDTIVLNTLNEAIYYRVSAFDRSYNTSEWSEPLRVERPDVVAPTPPVLLLPKPSGEGVTLSWNASSSTDAEVYRILRRVKGGEEPWALVDSVAATATTFADTSAQYEVTYEYQLFTVDDAALVSEPSNIQAGRRVFTADVGGVDAVTVALLGEGEQARPQVQWTFEKPSVDLLAEADHRFMLYRAAGDAPLARYKQLKSKDPTFTDTSVEAGVTYRYALMVVYSNGKKSGLSAEQRVTIPKEGE